MTTRFLLVAITFALLASSGSYSQQSAAPATRPKIGLVLEGGSALGLAHIGVLKWLEEHRIPIHYVAGTSMGGLVGGIYATGLSAIEVEQLVKTIDWEDVLGGEAPYKDLSFRRKQDAVEYPGNMEFGLRNGLEFPEGFNSGQQVISILDRVALPYSTLQDFNDLPIPFACVGTDLTTSQQYVFREGSLAVALRSTMSLPGIFTPVRTEDHIFADGGLLNNLPVDIAKNMGADLTLAVHLEAAKIGPDAKLSSLSVLGHSMSVVVAANELRSMEKADLLISVPLEKFNSMDFSRFNEIIRLGYEAAQSKTSILSTLTVDEVTWQAYLAERKARRRTVPVPQFVEVNGTRPTLAKAIEKELDDTVGKPVDTQQIENQLTNVKGEGRFNSLSYQITEKDGQPGLLITANEKPYSPPTVRPLLLLDGSNFGGTNFSFGARITYLDIGSYRSEWRNDVMIGTEYGLISQYYHPLSPASKWFVAPDVLATYLRFPLYDKDQFLAEYRKTIAGGGIELGYEFGKISQLSVGYTAGYERYVPKIGDASLLPTVSGRLGQTTIRYLLNDVDDPVIPRSGQAADVSGSWIDADPGAAHSFPLAEGKLKEFLRISDPSSMYFGTSGGTTFGNELVGVPPFALGGPNYFAAYGQNELLTNQYYLFQAGYIRKVAKLPVLLGKGVFFHGAAEVGKVFGPPFNSQVPADGLAALVINTLFGPVEFGGAAGATGHRSVFFQLGRIF